MTNYTLTFEPSQKQGNFPQGVSIRDAALELGILIESPCAGLGFCGKCKVKIPDGAGPVTAAERVKLTQDELDGNVRLACQATLQSEITCVIPQENQVLPEQISVAGLQGHFPLNPDVQAISLNVPKPQLSDKYFLWEALQQELQKSGYSQVQPTLVNLTQLQKASSQSSGEFTVVMFQEELLEITTENVQTNLYGIAIDIGTTTVVMKLLELKTGKVLGVRSAENRQYQYGADVISRLNYVESHDDGLHQLHNLIIGQLNDLTETLTTLTGISQPQIYSAVITGNTVMQHLFLGINPLSLASAPYYPVFQGSVITAASALDLQLHTNARISTVPNLASFVGGDITSVLTVLDLETTEPPQLVVDIGTNGEIVLGNQDRIICASSPAGPAWEGANIQWGMRATRGAIERALIKENQFIIRTIGDAEPTGICGSGLIDLVASFRRAGIIDESGRILNPDDHSGLKIPEGIQIIPRENGTTDIAIALLDSENPILLTQKDIREVQLAKSAILSGITMLMREFDIQANDLSAIYIAGGFGNHVRGEDAVDIGLLPMVDPDKIHFIGNAALTGAEAILLSREAREKAEWLSEKVDYVEISGKSEFQDIFVESMSFPSLKA